MILHRLRPLLLSLAVLAMGACASGSAIVTGNTRTPVAPEHVKIYLEPPASFEVIGLVKASSGAGWNQQEATDYAVEELKRQAGKLGANGVLLTSSGQTPVTTYMPGSGSARGTIVPVTGNENTVGGEAIFVEGK